MPKCGKDVRTWADTAARMVLAAFFLCAAWSSPATAEDVTDLLARGDAAYAGRADLNQAILASEYFRQAYVLAPDNFDAAIKLAGSLCWIVDHSPKDKRKPLAAEAVDAAKRAVALKPDHPAGYFHLGVAYGFYGDAHGIIRSLFLLEPIREAMNKVIELDPSYEAGGAYSALGRLNFFMPRVLGGGNDKAIEFYKTALRYGPRRWVNHLYLAEAYISEGRDSEARELLYQILNGKPEPGLEPEYVEWKGEAEYWLNKLSDKAKQK